MLTLYISCCFRSGCICLFIELLKPRYCPRKCCIVRFESVHLSLFVYISIRVWYCAFNLTVLSVALYLVQIPKNVDIYPPDAI